MVRLNKYLSEIGYCSRRVADNLIEEGRIEVNGNKAILGLTVSEEDIITVDGKKLENVDKKNIYIALNKPVGIVCTTDTKREKNNIIDFVNYPERIFPIGRLDKPSEGLILLTNDGDIVNKILRSRNHHEKEYLVKVDRPITQNFIDRMSNGVPILDTITKKAKVLKISNFEFKITLTQGLNRQIRRMCEYLGYEVKSLKRIRIMNILLDVQPGKWRHLTSNELKDLQNLLKDSSKINHISQ